MSHVAFHVAYAGSFMQRLPASASFATAATAHRPGSCQTVYRFKELIVAGLLCIMQEYSLILALTAAARGGGSRNFEAGAVTVNSSSPAKLKVRAY